MLLLLYEVVCMASRMDRYYKTNSETRKRSYRNESLYDTIYDDATEYSNVEGIARIEHTNEIDIRRIREMLKEEEAKKMRNVVQPVFKRTVPLPTIEEINYDKDDRNYDIRDILVKAKKEKEEEENDQYRDLKNTQYNILKKLKVDDSIQSGNYEQPSEENDSLRELIHTITTNSMLNELGDKELSLDLLDDLKSDHTNTSTLNKNAIHKILEEAKEKQKEKNDNEDDIRELDKSFFTSSLNFSDEDFDELKELSTTYRRNNILIKVLIAIIVIAIIIMIVLYFMNMPK